MAKKIKISLAAARVNANMSQSDTARAMNVTPNTVSNWETGKTALKVWDSGKDYCAELSYEFCPENMLTPHIEKAKDFCLVQHDYQYDCISCSEPLFVTTMEEGKRYIEEYNNPFTVIYGEDFGSLAAVPIVFEKLPKKPEMYSETLANARNEFLSEMAGIVQQYPDWREMLEYFKRHPEVDYCD